MNYSIRVIRLFFLILCGAGSYLVSLVVPEWDAHRWVAVVVGLLMGVLVILIDILLKGFSLRGLSALTFGLFVGWAVAHMISTSPLFDFSATGDRELTALLTQNLYLARMALFVVLMYLGAVLALRGKDEFNLVIPYVRFVPHGVDVPLAVVDTSALIDGRIVAICETKFLGHALIIPRFVIEELHRIADAREPQKRARGRRGLDALRRLREMPHVDLRINESSLEDRQRIEAKLVFLAQSLKAKILSTDYNLAQIAAFQNVEWLNIAALAKAMNPDTNIGDTLTVELIKPGREPGQAVGYLHDGSMVVVNGGDAHLDEEHEVRVTSVIPSVGGKMIFAELNPPLKN